jgi:hypothetical protein
MPNGDRGKRVVLKNVTRTSTRQTYTLENLPDEYRNLLPPDVLERIRQGAVDMPGLSELRQHDAAFDQAAFLERAATIVAAVRRAERDGGWDMARPFMSERLFRRWKPWAESLKTNDGRSSSNVSRQLTMAAVDSQAGYDRITVRVTEDSMPSPDSSMKTRWSFLRSAAGRTGHQTETSATICTNCGAPIDATIESTCRFCGAGVATLGPEWVLDDVAQDSPSSTVAASS